MTFDPERQTIGLEGVVFDELVRDHVDGVVALYHSGWLQFIPNPFSPRNIDHLCAAFPRTLLPFKPASDCH
jgi:hypothetical protein